MPIAIGIAITLSAVSAAASIATLFIANQAVKKVAPEVDRYRSKVDTAFANIETVKRALRSL